MTQVITYGVGGFDATKPNNNIISIEEIPDPVSEIDNKTINSLEK